MDFFDTAFSDDENHDGVLGHTEFDQHFMVLEGQLLGGNRPGIMDGGVKGETLSHLGNERVELFLQGFFLLQEPVEGCFILGVSAFPLTVQDRKVPENVQFPSSDVRRELCVFMGPCRTGHRFEQRPGLGKLGKIKCAGCGIFAVRIERTVLSFSCEGHGGKNGHQFTVRRQSADVAAAGEKSASIAHGTPDLFDDDGGLQEFMGGLLQGSLAFEGETVLGLVFHAAVPAVPPIRRQFFEQCQCRVISFRCQINLDQACMDQTGFGDASAHILPLQQDRFRLLEFLLTEIKRRRCY